MVGSEVIRILCGVVLPVGYVWSNTQASNSRIRAAMGQEQLNALCFIIALQESRFERGTAMCLSRHCTEESNPS